MIDEWPAKKTEKSCVNLAVQRRNRVEYATWQARIGATAAWALDGTRQVIKREGAPWEYVNARASVRHDGFVQGGRLEEPEGADNYIDELAAQMDMALAEDRGSRIIVTFDAVSPVKAASCAIRIPRRIPRINPAAAAQLLSPSTRTAPSA